VPLVSDICGALKNYYLIQMTAHPLPATEKRFPRLIKD
jgi:hypothetical protein